MKAKSPTSARARSRVREARHAVVPAIVLKILVLPQEFGPVKRTMDHLFMIKYKLHSLQTNKA
jgi:hypothetical protein